MTERCELLLRAKSLAIKKGLDDTLVECPAIRTCTGTSCLFQKIELPDQRKKKGVKENDHHL